MTDALNILSWVLLMGGVFFCVVGAIGILRFPDFYCRTHAASITDTLGAGLILAGLSVQAVLMMLPGEQHVAGSWMILVKLLMVGLFILLTSPTSGHALVKAAYAHGLKWTNEGTRDELSD